MRGKPERSTEFGLKIVNAAKIPCKHSAGVAEFHLCADTDYSLPEKDCVDSDYSLLERTGDSTTDKNTEGL